MGDLSEHFNRHEFCCNCGCSYDTVDHKLIIMLERVRFAFNAQVFINSACRCLKHNREIGSKDTSQHILGKAADIKVEDVPPNDVADFFREQFGYCCGIGEYNTFTHVDCRDKRARWDNRG